MTTTRHDSAPGSAPDWDAIARLVAHQDGVVSRRQVLEGGLRPHDIERMLRRRLWARILPGVYVDHTGVPTWRQRAWAGVLHHWPAALAGVSALQAAQGPGWRGHQEDAEIEIAISATRTATAGGPHGQTNGCRVVRVRGLEGRVQWNASPPRMRLEVAVVDMAAAAVTDFDSIAVLADACGSRRTTAQRLLESLAGRSRVRRRAWIEGVLVDVAEGTCSVLEHAYLSRVESPHGLPRGKRQAPSTSGSRRMFRDVLYEDLGLIVELDGRLFHDSTGQRDADLERDLDAAMEQKESVRLGWGQCTKRACRTAGKVGVILQGRGWAGSPTRCGPECTLR